MQLKLIICHPWVGSVTLAQGGGASGGADGGGGDGSGGEGGGGEGDGGNGGGGDGDGGGGGHGDHFLMQCSRRRPESPPSAIPPS